jgi:conjugative relaxase-like TrwC/TraI family protein
VAATLHKLTAGDGYLYLIRQVAASDSTERGRNTLSEYYSAKGESPGRWVGTGLASLSDTGAREVSEHVLQEIWTVPEGSEVHEEQMAALFGEGLHPNAVDITNYTLSRGAQPAVAIEAAHLGRRFAVRTGETEFQRALAVAYREHNTRLGQKWNTPIDDNVRAQIRTTLAWQRFADQYGRKPADDRELSGFIARNTRARTTAVAGYDVTFSPVKSVSALWAVAPLDVAREIEECHDAAVADALAFMETEAAFTRSGAAGVAQVDTTGLIGTAFTHRDSRAGDPDLHTHVAISNKVATIDVNGVQRWLALDGQPLHRLMVAVSELYNTRLEAHLGQRLGLQFSEMTPPGRGKRPIREIIGVKTELNTRWSSRRQAIEARTAELSKQFQSDHGREPTNVEAIALAQQATLESREAKHEPRSLAEQRHTWRAEAVEVLGGHHELSRMIGQSLSISRHHHTNAVTPEWIIHRARQVVATVAVSRSTWQRHHVLAEAQRIVRSTGCAADDTLAQRITSAALAEPISLPLARIDDGDMGEPAALRRRDGSSVYTRAGIALYTSAEIVAAERRLLHAATLDGGRTVADTDVEIALADSAARGKNLNPGQAALITEMATNGRRLALALAPAGAGKTTAMAALSHAWRSSGGTVLGLAPTAAASISLGADLTAPTDTLDKYIHLIDNPSRAAIPKWFTNVDSSTLLIVDEAGKAGTLQLDVVISHALANGATVRLVGDDGQIASISAGGVLRDIAAETDSLTLSQLVRFTAPEEGAASLALRAGDPSGIGFYIDLGRVHVGADETAADMAFQAWLADQRAGRDTLLLAPTNAIVDELNVRARCARLAALAQADPHWRPGRETVLADRLAASAGDIIRSRDNARWLRLSATDYVRNGYTFEVLEVGGDGSLRVRHIGTDREITLPANYATTDVTLGYATTIDGSQGLTAGYSCHVVGAEHITRQLLYVALTRGRVENHVYLSTAEDDPHRILAPKATHPDTAVDVLSKILARDGAQVSATTAEREAADPLLRIAAAADMYHDALGTAAENHLGATQLDKLATLADTLYPRLTHTQGWPVLRNHLALLACAGHNPAAALLEAVAKGGLDDAGDPAAVLDWRIDPTGGHSAGVGPLRWLPAVPDRLGENPQWGQYLHRRADLVTELADQIRANARAWTPGSAPAWAKPLIGTAPELAAEIAVFRAAHRVAPEDSRLVGAQQNAARPRTIQRLLQDAAVDAIGRRRPAVARFRQLIDSVDPRIRSDSFWPQLAEHLAQAAPSRPDLAHLVVDAASEHPLPDELPAAALWWRLSGKISHTATLDTPNAKIRPPWITDLAAVFGSAVAETIAADPAWPGLVAAIATADPKRWTPRDLLHLAAEQLADADPDGRSIAVYEYARWITHTVDMVTTSDPTAHPHHNLPTPDHAPLTREEEEELAGLDPEHIAPDDQLPPPELGDVDDLQRWINDTLVDDQPPPSHPGTGDEEDLGSLQFEDLSPRRVPPPPLPAALLDVSAMRTAYHQALDEHDTLASGVATFNGPALNAAMPQIREMRADAEADRPHWLAVAEVIDQWADADAQYDAEVAQIDWAQTQLDHLLATPDTDPLDIASARADLRLRRMTLPTVSPAERFYPALTAANTARAAGAGGAEHIVTDTDVDRAIAAANDADRQALRTARRRCSDLLRDLDRAELAAAAAFAAADSRPVEHVLAQQADLETELRLLAAAGQYHVGLPLVIGAGSPDDRTHAAIARTTELPFTLAVVTAPPGRELTAALSAVSDAANNADRHILWCTPTADHLPHNALGEDSTSVDNLHQRLIDNTWCADRGEILIVEAAAAADPAMLADLTEHTAQQHARIILLDTTPATWPLEPSARLLHLAHTDLPWSTTVADPAATPRRGAATPTAPDLEPIISQAARLHPDMLTDDLRGALTRRNILLREHQRTNEAHRAASWIRSRERSAADELPPQPGLEL